MTMTGRRNVADKRRASPMSVLLRRLYLAASELHPGILAALLAVHMAASYVALRLAGEPELRPPVAFIYWYATTASTVGYGDLSPKGDAGRLVAAFWVMPGAIALFTTAIARTFAGLSHRWRRRRLGLGDYRAMQGHVVLIGHEPTRTARMVAELAADGCRDIVVVATDDLPGDDPGYRYVRAASLTAPADLHRAGVATAARIVVYAATDAETLAATLAVTALGEAAHIVCFLRDADTARLLHAHCPAVEAVVTPTVELVVKALSDPGSSHLLAQLASHTDAGATLYACDAAGDGGYDEVAGQLRERGAVLVASCPAGAAMPRFDLDRRIARGDRLFYVARERLSS
jgi:voltage-gated potassium channel